MLRDRRHRQRVQRLQQQRPQPADEHGVIGVHVPDRTVVGEHARTGRVVDPPRVLLPFGARDLLEQALAQLTPQCIEHSPMMRDAS